jgi:hypothetical protein
MPPALAPDQTRKKNGTPVTTRPGLVSVFVDWSNIFIPMRKKFPGRTINVRALAATVMGSRTPRSNRSLIVGASVPAEQNPDSPRTTRAWWKRAWEAAGYRVEVGVRPHGAGEQFVDDMLHAQIYREMREHEELPGTLCLLTGDGNDNGKRSSFPETARHALEAGWRVEIWAWHSACHHMWPHMARHYHRMTVKFLESYTGTILD